MLSKQIFSLVLGLSLVSGSPVLGQHSPQQQNPPSQNPPKSASFKDRVKNWFGIDEPMPTPNQNPHQQQQQPAHNHGPANVVNNHGNNVNAQQQMQQRQVQPQNLPNAVTQRPATVPANPNAGHPNANSNNLAASARVQNSALVAGPGQSRVPQVSRGTTFAANGGDPSSRIANAAPAESDETTLNRLDRIRGSIFEKTAESRAQMLQRKEATIVARNDLFETPEREKPTEDSKVGISSTRRTYVAEIEEEETEPPFEEPIAKRSAAAPKIALPKTVPPSSESRSKTAVVETVAPPKKSEKQDEEKIANSKKKPAAKEPVDEWEDEESSEVAETVVKTDDLSLDDEDESSDQDEQSMVVSTEKDFVETEDGIAEEHPKVRLETGPRKVASRSLNPSVEKTKTEDISVEPQAAEPVKVRTASAVAVLEVNMNGPKKRVVGQESPYQFTISNNGGAVAEQVVLTVELPIWAEIQSFDPKVGSTSVEEKDAETNLVNWTIDRLEAGESQQLVIHLIPRQRKSLTMSWDYNFKQPVSQMVVDVLEAKLEMSLEGPFEMMWGTEEEFRLRVQNTGNGDAEDVHLTLLASENEPGESETVPMGTLKAGQEKILTVSAFAKQQEKLEISVQATGPFGLQADAKRTVKILRPKLTTTVEAPEMQFVGNQSEYRIVVQNTGTASAHNVEVKAMIPSSAKYVSHRGNGRVLPSLQNQVIWTIDTIPVGEEFSCTLVCEMKRDGVCQVDVSATEKTGLSATAVASTQVDAIADLTLQLKNPEGPVEVGKIAYHTITVTNRGSKPAENVEIIAAFAEGVSPVDVEGGKASIDDSSLGETGGQVFFDKIPVVGPKQSVVLKIKAKSEVSGKQKVRVEMICVGTDTHLIHEESTHYYSKVKGETPALRKSNRETGSEEKRVALNRPTPTAAATTTPTTLSPKPVVPPLSVPDAPKSKPAPAASKAKTEPATPAFEPLAENFEDFVFEEFK